MEDKRWVLKIVWHRVGKMDEYRFFTLPELRAAVQFLRLIQERQGHKWLEKPAGWTAQVVDPEHGGVVCDVKWFHSRWHTGGES